MSPPTRPATRQEIVAYLCRIHHPAANDKDEANLALVVQQDPMRILSVDTVTSPPLDSSAIQDRLVRRHLGGYCYFHALQLSRILLGLGYTCRPVSAFVRESADPSWKQREIPLPKRPTHCCILLEMERKRYLVDCGFARRGPLVPIPLPDSQQVGEAGDVAGSPTLPSETWRVVVADLSVLVQPDDAETSFPNPTYLLQHRSLRPGQTKKDAQWDVIYAFTTETQDLETYERLSWHVCIGDKGISHKFREYFTVSRTYQPASSGPEYPREEASDQFNSDFVRPVDFTAGLARLNLTNMELSSFVAGEKKVLCVFKDEQERIKGLERWFGLKGPFDGRL
ncbi:hypothetical protein QFC22_004817 [Naganishia vaughanmartiniae]|uniref:Uncharacterized protein n=1 Tax=Naganishia vaughanmartiniae TaxID=1424756 RepID=A0ACC2WYD7_9TREE|nr:hypothetical protein QFC22_004817 [Naganishia vaughanmartiniae]